MDAARCLLPAQSSRAGARTAPAAAVPDCWPAAAFAAFLMDVARWPQFPVAGEFGAWRTTA
eukprot:296452-Lingulodinium_polyedra.AAC.1